LFATYILGPIFALLPRRWRERVLRSTPGRVARAATISGILESVLSLLALVGWYSIYATLASEAIDHSSSGASAGSERIGLFGYVWFWMNPITWVVAYFILEGVTRSLAALVTGEAYGTMPLCVMDYLFRRMKRGRAKPELPLVPDEITPGDAACDMKVASCRARLDWTYPFTIRYSGAYFQVVARIDLGAGPRPYVYSLRRLPHGEIAQGLKEYHPDDILTAIQPLEPVEK
jgi:hypothetical protein